MEIVQVGTAEQLQAVRELYLEYYHFILQTYGVDMGYDYFQSETAALPGAYAPPAGRLLLAQEEGEAAGCAGLRRVTEERAELKRLYVRPGFRGQGVGRSLVTALIDGAREMGYRWVQVHTAEFLTEALQLYRGLGFREIPPTSSDEAVELFLELPLHPRAEE